MKSFHSPTTSDSTDYSDTQFYVSHQADGSYNAVMGSIAQLRITRGIARHTADYTTCADGFATSPRR